jgi:hypothetical protein
VIKATPYITEHAYLRAGERMKLSRSGFVAWVQATCREWMPVNAGYLIDRELKVSAHDSIHYVSPWTQLTMLALTLSPDNAIKTVMTYAESRAPKRDDRQVGRAVSCGICAAAVRMLCDGVTDPRDFVRRSLGVSTFDHGGASIEPAIEAFGRRDISLESLRGVIAATGKDRTKLLCEALAQEK